MNIQVKKIFTNLESFEKSIKGVIKETLIKLNFDNIEELTNKIYKNFVADREGSPAYKNVKFIITTQTIKEYFEHDKYYCDTLVKIKVNEVEPFDNIYYI